jgi:chromosome segregation ATPase
MQADFDARYSALRDECNAQILSLRDEAAGYKSKLADGISAFDDKARQLKEAYEANKGVKSDEVEAMKRKHQKEIAEVVQQHNEKFMGMLAEQMVEQDKIKSLLTEEKRDALLKAAEDAQHALEKLRAEMTATFDSKVDKINAAHDAKVAEQQQAFADKMSKAVNDITALKAEINDFQNQLTQSEKLQAMSNAEIERLKQTISQLKDQLNQSGSDADKQLASLREEIGSLKQSLDMKEDQLDTLNKTLAADRQEAAATKSNLMKELGDAHEIIEKLKAAGGDSGKEIERLTTACMDAEQEILKLKSKISSLEATVETKTQDAEKQKQSYEDKIADLRAEIEKLKASMGANSGALQKEIDALKLKVDETKMQGAANLRTAEEQHAEKLSAAAAKFEQDLKVVNDEHAAAVKQWELKVSDAVSAGERAAAAEKQKTAEMKVTGERNVAQTAKEHEAKLAKALKEWEDERNQLNKRIADLSTNSAAETDLLKGDVSRFKKETAALTAELEKNKSEVTKLNGIAADLKRQIDELRKELEANASAAKAKMDAELAKLKEYYEGVLGKNDGANADALMKMEMDMKEKMDAELKKLREELENVIEEERANLAALGEKSEAEKKSLNEQLASEKERHSASVERLERIIKDLTSSGKDSMDNLVKAHKEEIERLKKMLTEEHEGRMADAKKNEERLKKEIELKHDEEKKRLDEEAREKLEHELRMAAQAELDKLRQADAKLKEELARLEKELKDQHDGVVGGLKDDHEKVVGEVERMRAETQEALDQEAIEKANTQRMLSEAKAEIERLNAEMTMKLRQAAEDREEEKVALLREAANAKAFLEEQHRSEMDAAMVNWTELEAGLNGEIAGLKGELEAMHERYLARESRPEDVERIQQLEREAVEKDALVKKTKEEMIYFKRELLNREENFNKKFNTNPNVGVMAVIKPKGDAKGGRGAGGKDANQRRRSSAMNQPPVPPSGPQFGF